jgi:solute carrier family 13 (sodium-dependent dicarboxylate transporter), member 2/3/5
MKNTEAEHPHRSPTIFIAAVVIAMAVTWVMLNYTDVPRAAAFMSGIFTIATLLWATEALPFFATSLLIIGLEVVLLANPGGWSFLGESSADTPGWREILSAAADPVLLLFFGGFLLARAAVNEGVDRALSSLLLGPFGGKPRGILLGVILVTALFSMWMSNTATTAMMITLVMAMCTQMPPGEPFRKTLVLAVPIAANIGGIGTPIASPPNAVAVGFLQKAGLQVSFVEWMVVAVPLMIGLLLFAWWVLWQFHPPANGDLRLIQRPQRLNRRGGFVVAVFSITVALWLTVAWHGIPAAIVALLPAIAFTATGIISRKDINSLDWHILILIAGGITLGAGMQMTGLDATIASWLPSSGGLWLLAALVLATLIAASFMSNTAAANLLLPIGISAAMAGGSGGSPSPVQAALCIAMASSFAMVLPVSTPPNAIAYATGEFTSRDLARIGIFTSLVGAVLLITGSQAILRLWSLL